MPNEYAENSVVGEADQIIASRPELNSGVRIKTTSHFGGSSGYRSMDHRVASRDQAVETASTYTGVFPNST